LTGSDHFRGLTDIIPEITRDTLEEIKYEMLRGGPAYRYVALIQLNTGMRVSEPALARVEDCVLEHDIPHLWVRRNVLSTRKTRTSIRAVPLVGVSLDTAKSLVARAELRGSQWLVPESTPVRLATPVAQLPSTSD
jgi:integrase